MARRVASWQAKGHQVVVVVSAMSGETNRLIALAKEVQANRFPARVGCHRPGEQVTIGLLSMALMDIGVRPEAIPADQVRILTDNAYTKARIVNIDRPTSGTTWIRGMWLWWRVFRVLTMRAASRTLERGGSDTSSRGHRRSAEGRRVPDALPNVDEVSHHGSHASCPGPRRTEPSPSRKCSEWPALGSKIIPNPLTVVFAGKIQGQVARLEALKNLARKARALLITFEEEHQDGTTDHFRHRLQHATKPNFTRARGTPDCRASTRLGILGPVAGPASMSTQSALQNCRP
ncbi:MAG: hypothetical protein M5R42_05465 [Rhodocyclaceae bacterium]|nr:hypothetical protein [Rhodocyclaceae bacterium]